MELRFFEAGTIPEYSTREWHEPRDRAPHLEQASHQPRLLKAAEFVKQAYGLIPHRATVVTVADFGCGDGGLLSLLPYEPSLWVWGYDFTPANVAGAAERNVNVVLMDFVNDNRIEFGEIAVMTEVLEHMADPHGFLRRCHTVGVTYVVASSPVDETEHNHVGYHVWAWDMEGYAAMIEQAGFGIVEHVRVDGGFQVVLAKR